MCVSFVTMTSAQAATISRAAQDRALAAPAGAAIAITSSQRASLLELPLPSAGTLSHHSLAGFTDFHDFGSGTDGQNPSGAILQGLSGSLYGETTYGGPLGNGTLFKSPTTPSESATNFYNFGVAPDGANPAGGLFNLVGDVALTGYLYGVTTAGGANGTGAIFRVDTSGHETVVYSFSAAGASDGAQPTGRLVAFVDGNYYGTASSGGAYGAGTIFKFNPLTKSFKKLYDFNPSLTDGGTPFAGLALSVSGFYLNCNLFGVTSTGGAYGEGTLFSVNPESGKETTLYSFGNPAIVANGGDASSPDYELIPDENGNEYGVGGNGIFKYTPKSGAYVLLHQFGSDSNGLGATEAPLSINYLTGVLYGSTSEGGITPPGGFPGGAIPLGTVFRLDPSKPVATNFSVLHTFSGNDGAFPDGKLNVSWDGNLYGVTSAGGATGEGEGILFGLPIQ
jgi:uncharacterized repeat protein (TIGR03803 family)